MNLVLPIELNQEAEPGTQYPFAERLQRLTEDEFFAFCQANRQLKFERRADGTITYMSLTGGDTGRRNTKLVSRLDRWTEESGLGLIFDSSTGFRLPSGAVRSPDAAWVSTAAWEALTDAQRAKFPPLCPEFVVELLSASDSLSDLMQKAQEFLDNGCRLVWLLVPKTETARIYRADGSVSVVKSFDEILNGEDVPPGFTLPLHVLR